MTTGRASTRQREIRAAAFAWLCWSCAFASLTISATQADAQIRAPVSGSSLTDIAVDEKPDGGAAVGLTFDLAPKFAVSANDTDAPIISFALTARGNGAHYPSSFRGLLRSISLEQDGSLLVMQFKAATPVHLAATAVSDTRIGLLITKATHAPVEAETAAASTAFPSQVERNPGEDDFEVVPLKYADVSEVVGLLTDGQTVKSNDVFTPHEPGFGSASMNGTSYAPPPPQGTGVTDDPLAQSVNDTIGIDRRLNAIILKGSPERIARLKEKIAEIDVPVESVILETMFVELDQTGARNVGVSYNNANGQIGVATLTTGTFTPSGFATGKALSSGSLQAAIYAQVQDQHGKIVSKPRIAALSGSTAKIITGDAIPILTSITLSGVNGVSQQVQYVNVGVTLQIAPRVSMDGFVTSHIFCDVSSVTGTDSQGYPTISQREAQTSATVHDGETFVIGGLTEDDVSLSNSHVPILGSIPLLNSLFGLEQDTSTKTDLYIVVTPHIVKPGEKLPDEVTSADRPVDGK